MDNMNTSCFPIALAALKGAKGANERIDTLPLPMVFKGTVGVGGTISTLPTASSENEGYVYIVITDGTYAGQSAKAGDTFVSDGSSWVLVPSGDEPSVIDDSVTSTALTWSSDKLNSMVVKSFTYTGTGDLTKVIHMPPDWSMIIDITGTTSANDDVHLYAPFVKGNTYITPMRWNLTQRLANTYEVTYNGYDISFTGTDANFIMNTVNHVYTVFYI